MAKIWKDAPRDSQRFEYGPPTQSVQAFDGNDATVRFATEGAGVCPQCGGGCEIKFTSDIPFSRIHPADKSYSGTCPVKNAPVMMRLRDDPDSHQIGQLHIVRLDFSVPPKPAACPNDTNGDGDCGRRYCPHCSTVNPEGRQAYQREAPPSGQPLITDQRHDTPRDIRADIAAISERMRRETGLPASVYIDKTGCYDVSKIVSGQPKDQARIADAPHVVPAQEPPR